MNAHVRIHRSLYLATTLTLVVAGCGQSGGDQIVLPPAAHAPTATVEVQTATARTESLAVPVRATGTTQPARAANLGPQITARVAAILVTEGDQVRTGQPLVRLDAADARLRAAQASAGATGAEVQAQLAADEHARLAPLVAEGAVPQQRVDQLQGQARALRESASAARALAAQARRGVTNTTVTAPFDGTVQAVRVEVGEVATMAPATILLRLVDLSQIEVRVQVPERDLARLTHGDAIVARMSSVNREVTGTVTFIAGEIDPRSRSAEVVTLIPNTDAALRAGMFAEVEIRPTRSREATVVPASAVVQSGDDQVSYVVTGGRARRRRVRAEVVDEQRMEIVEGLRPGDVVVASALDRLSDGARVTVRAAAPRSAGAAAPAAPSAEARP